MWAFSTAGCKMQRPSQIWKKIWHPSHPTVAPSPQEGGRHPNSRLERKPVQLQGNTVLFTRGKLANCGKIAHGIGVCDGHEFKPHLRGSWGRGPQQQRSAAYRAKSLTSTRMLPPLRRRTVDTGPEAAENKSPPPRAHVRHHTMRFQHGAFSAAGCKMQRPPQVWKKIVLNFFKRKEKNGKNVWGKLFWKK